jgi:hypothetical protein
MEASRPQIVVHVGGIPALVDWLGHVSMMGLYSVLHGVISPVVDTMKNPRAQFRWRRRVEAWKFACRFITVGIFTLKNLINIYQSTGSFSTVV